MTATLQPRAFADYRSALIVCYEEEVSGEAYFAQLASFFAGRQCRAMQLLAEVERVTADAVRPVLARRGFAAAGTAALQSSGHASADKLRGTTWEALIADMVENFPAFVEEFEQVARMAPAEDRAVAQILIDHEIAAIDFAKLEAAGDPDSLRPLEQFIAACTTAGPPQ